MGGQQQRRQYVVDQQFQFKYVRLTLVFVLFVLVASAAGSYFFIWTFLRRLGLLQNDVMSVISHALGFSLLFQLVIAIPFVMVSGTLMTHRVAGPFKRIEMALDGIGSGELNTTLQVRKNDELQSLVNWINRMAQRLEQLRHDGKLAPPKTTD